MSGHTIATPVLVNAIEGLAPVFAGVAAGAGISLAGVALAVSVKRVIDIQAAAAVEHQCAERQKLEEWFAFQLKQQEKLAILQRLELALQAAEGNLAAVDVAAPVLVKSEAAWAGPEGPTAHSAIGIGKDRVTTEQIGVMLDEVRRMVTGLPNEFREAENSPYALLSRHAAALTTRFQAGERVLLTELNAFKETIARTLSDFHSELNSKREHMQVIGSRLETCLNEILFYEHLASSPKLMLLSECQELTVLRGQVVALLRADEVNIGVVDLMDRKLSTLKAAIDKEVVCAAHRQALTAELARHLDDLGYEMVDEFYEDGTSLKAALRIPGGERLQVAIHHNGQMAFEVVHERSGAEAAGELRIEEAEFLVQQEQRWCKDMRQLIRRLAADGFPFTVDFEKAIPSGAVKVVVVETPDEILAQESDNQYQDEPKRRYLA